MNCSLVHAKSWKNIKKRTQGRVTKKSRDEWAPRRLWTPPSQSLCPLPDAWMESLVLLRWRNNARASSIPGRMAMASRWWRWRTWCWLSKWSVKMSNERECEVSRHIRGCQIANQMECKKRLPPSPPLTSFSEILLRIEHCLPWNVYCRNFTVEYESLL